MPKLWQKRRKRSIRNEKCNTLKVMEDIKVGELYNVRVKVVDVDDDTGEITTETVNENGNALGFELCYYATDEVEAFSPITAANGIKNTETAPKYAPCRKFRKGDKVELLEQWNGRHPTVFGFNVFTPGEILTVLDDEDEMFVLVENETYKQTFLTPFLKLVTPVEELEPYSVKLRQEITVDDTYPYCAVVDDDGNEAARFYCEQYEAGKAQKAAEAECARLNAEYIKEKK